MLLELANWMIARRNFEEAKKALLSKHVPVK
jgi:hypothetical protein